MKPTGPEQLKRALAAREWSQGDLERAIAKHLGRVEIGDGLVSKWMNSKRVPGLEYALAIETLLGVPARAWLESDRTSDIDAE